MKFKQLYLRMSMENGLAHDNVSNKATTALSSDTYSLDFPVSPTDSRASLGSISTVVIALTDQHSYRIQHESSFSSSLASFPILNTGARSFSEDTQVNTLNVNDIVCTIPDSKKSASSNGYRTLHCLHFKSRRAAGLFFFVVFILLVALGIGGFFLYPRKPQFKLVSLEIARTPSGKNDIALESGTLSSPVGLVRINMEARLSITNEGYYGIQLEDIEVLGTVGDYKVKVLNGTLSKLNIPLDKPVEVVFPLTLQFKLDQSIHPDAIESEQVLSHVLEHCGVQGSSDVEPIHVDYTVEAKLSPLLFLGNIIKLDRYVKFTCPPTVRKLVSSIKSLRI
ncbi:hypothetical protein BDF19DRAFT_422431 [Syncephalis fuscata]|nr:hypothetical protein BDF19DRAFT_422431 [Syncephalis fuscata]